MDSRVLAFRGGISGPVIITGKPSASSLLERVKGAGEQERMPLDEEPLSNQQIELLQRWIEQGAPWPEGVGARDTSLKKHWAYIPPLRPTPLETTSWAQNPLDAFVEARITKEHLAPSPQADPAKLVRRVYLDLIGLPPSVEELNAYLADQRPDRYHRLVDRLLASPRYGERWARPWLDLARYADSNGFQADQYREVWPYRDWVIDAINADMPFDRFTLEQIAGDLLPQSTARQRIATGFHRLTTCNVEAGVDPEENRVNQVIDRVNTTGSVWLGTTIECAQCHNHKYDPFTQQDYYRLFAYFNNTPLEVAGNGVTFNFTGPKMELPLHSDKQQQRATLQQQIEAQQRKIDALTAKRTAQQSAREKRVLAGADDSPPRIVKILRRPLEKRTASQKKQVREFFLKQYPALKKARQRKASLQKQLDAIQPTTTLVMVEQEKPRMTHVFRRGNFLDKQQPVRPGTPQVLGSTTGEPPADRLGLAKWLTHQGNPLTARVSVNRWWGEFFGRGLVATQEDFGSQGERPSHPQVLDWLACEFMSGGWSMKHTHRLIVYSATYQQSSKVSPLFLRLDPQNRFYARGPRFRLPAETLRDNALAICGLLGSKMKGPPIYPPQPDNVWRHVGRNPPKYNTSRGEDRFRRGVYVVWRRSAPYPSFTNFDAPDRAACVIARPKTNTPLQALTLLNDPAYIEMAQGLALRMAQQPSAMSDRERIVFGFRLCVARRPTEPEVEHLHKVYVDEKKRMENHPETVAKLAAEEELLGAASGNLKKTELAAWFVVANVLLNLDETITKE